MFEHLRRGVVAAASGIAMLACGVALQAHAANPPASWTNQRVLDCDGATVAASLTPAGFGGSFHVVGSTDVIKEKHVEVVFPETTERVTTLDVPGFNRNGQDVVHCTYTDPDGLFVDFFGLRR
jgi:hypothetical protein